MDCLRTVIYRFLRELSLPSYGHAPRGIAALPRMAVTMSQSLQEKGKAG